jgi:hypothetical protein
LRLQLLPLNACDHATSLIVDLSTQVCLLIFGDLQFVAKTLNFDFQILGSADFFASIRREVVLVMRLWAIYNTESTKKILDWFASHAGSNFRTIASLAIQVALETLVCDGIWIVT